MTDQPTLVDLPAPRAPQFSERHIQAVAAALHEQWGPCDTDNADDCDGRTCHVTLVRAVLEQSAKMPVSVPADAFKAAHEEAWHVACCYGELIPNSGPTPHMALNKAHMFTVIARIAGILRGGDR